jgi:hypothetical protein
MGKRSFHFVCVPCTLAILLTNGSDALGNMTGICKRSLRSFLTTSNWKMPGSSLITSPQKRRSSNQFKLHDAEPDKKIHADTLALETAFNGDSITKIQTLEAPIGRTLKQHQVRDNEDDVNFYLDPTNSFIQVLERRENEGLATRQPGLHPHQSRFHQPIVYHPSYSFSSWPSQKQTFPSE